MTFKWISKWAHSESGATMVEYGIAVVVAVLVGTSGLILLGNQVNNNMASTAERMVPNEDN